MRPRTLLTIPVLTVGLLVAATTVMVAQDDPAEAPSGLAYFTGELDLADGRVAVEPEETIVDGVLEVRDVVFEGEAIVTSDARMSGSLSRVLNASVHKLDDFVDLVHETNGWRIENDGGSWSGQGSALVHAGGGLQSDDETNIDTVVLIGEGGYEGLSAYVLADWTEDPVAVKGAIFPSSPPPTPDFPAQVAE